MKYLFQLVFILGLSQNTCAQNYELGQINYVSKKSRQNIVYTNDANKNIFIAYDGSDSNYLTFTNTQLFSNTDSLKYCYLAKVKNGKIVFNKKIFTTKKNYFKAIDIKCDKENNIYLTIEYIGKCYFGDNFIDSVSTTNTNYFTTVVLKFDANGNFIKPFQLNCSKSFKYKTMVFDNNNNWIITGNFTGNIDADFSLLNFSISGHSTANHSFIAKYNKTGILLWAKKIGNSTNRCNIENLQIDKENSVIMTGDMKGTLDMDPNAGVKNLTLLNNGAFIMKWDSSSNYIWNRNFTDNANYVGYLKGLAIDDNNNIYCGINFSNYYNLSTDSSKTILVNTLGNYDIALLKLNKQGYTIKNNTFATANNELVQELIYHNNKLFVNGIFKDSIAFNLNKAYSKYPNNEEIYISIFDTQLFTLQTVSLSTEKPMPLLAFDSILFTSSVFYTDGIFLNRDSFITGNYPVPFSSNYNHNAFIELRVKIPNTIGVQNLNKFNTIFVYPNPANSILHINWSNDISIYNIMGKVCNNVTIEKCKDVSKINIAELSNGIYFLNLNNQTIKFIKQ